MASAPNEIRKYLPTKISSIDLQTVEDLYATGAPHFQAARALNMSDTYWQEIRSGKARHPEMENTAILAAIKRGQARIAQEVLANLREHSQKNVIASIFLAKQEGILGFTDGQTMRHTGQIDHVHHPVELAWKAREKKIEEARKMLPEPIDITPKSGA